VACAQCGFEASTVSPADAVVALRSFPRRFRELVPKDDDPVVLRTLQTHAGQAAAAITALGEDLRRVLVSDDVSLASDDGVATAPLPAGDLSTAIDRLAAAATGVADVAEHQPAEAWQRSSGPVRAIDLLRDAVHAGVHHLRAVSG
jgi:hypothetical protein